MFSYLRFIAIPLTVTVAGCAQYHSAPLDATAELRAFDERSVGAVVVTCGNETRAVTFNPTDGLDERELIVIALSLNTRLAAARSKIGESESQLLLAGQFPNPELGASVQPGIGGTNGKNADIDLMFELLRIGERTAKREVADANLSKIRTEIATEEYQVVSEVRQQLTKVLATEQELELLNQELVLRRQGSELISRRRDAGEANALDTAASELELADIEREQRESAWKVPQERTKLNQLLGLPPGYPLQLSDSGKPIEVRLIDVPAYDALRNMMLAGRLDLRQKEAEYNLAEQELRLEVVRQYPSFKIGPAFSNEAPGDNYVGVAVAMDVPIFNRNRGEIAAKLAQRDRVRAEYVDLLNQLTSEAYTSSELVNALRREVGLQQKQVLPLLERNSKLFRAALDARELNIVDFVTVQERALQTRRAYLRTLIQYRTAMIELDNATGMTLSGIRAVLPLPAPASASATTQSLTITTKENP